MSEPNYFKIPYKQLPSLGQLYPEGSSIRFRILQIRDLKYLGALDKENSTEIVNDVIKRCLKVDGMNVEDIYRMDRLSILFYLRRNTFMLSNGYQTEFTCPFCETRVSKQFQVHELAKKTIQQSLLRKIYIDGELIKGVYKKIFDPEYKTDDPELDMILNWTNVDEVYDHVNQKELEDKILGLPADQYAKLRHLASDTRCGILSYTELQCDNCFNKMRVGVDLSDDKLFNKVKLTTMIRNQIQVSKFCGINLTDDMPYNEVELTIAIVNDLSKKEAEAVSKTKGVAKQ